MSGFANAKVTVAAMVMMSSCLRPGVYVSYIFYLRKKLTSTLLANYPEKPD
jgi:hypothetical protein